MSGIKRITALLMALLLVLPGAALAKERTFQVTRFSVGFEASDQLPAAVADMLNMLHFSGEAAVYHDEYDVRADMLLGGNEKTRTGLHLWGMPERAALEISWLGQQKLLINMSAATEFAMKMYNHMSIAEAPAVALTFPYVTEEALDGLKQLAKPLLDPEKTVTVSKDQLIDMADRASMMMDTDRALSYWLACLWAAFPEQGNRLSNLLSYLPWTLEDVLPDTGMEVSVSGNHVRWKIGKDTVFSMTKKSMELNLKLQDTQFTAQWENRNGKLQLQVNWQENETTVLNLQLNASGMDEQPIANSSFTAELHVAGLGLPISDYQLTGQVDEQGNMSVVLNRDGVQMLRIFGEVKDGGTVVNEITAHKVLENSISLFSLSDVTLSSLIAESRNGLISGMLALVAEMPVSTISAVLDTLEQGGIFELMMNSGSGTEVWSEDEMYEGAEAY